MIKVRIALQKQGSEVELATSIPVQKGDHVVLRTPEEYPAYGVFMTGEVLEVTSDTRGLVEKFIQKIDTTYYDQMEQAKQAAVKMRETLDKIWSEKTDDEKLNLLSAEAAATDGQINDTSEEVPLDDTVEPAPEETAPEDTL